MSQCFECGLLSQRTQLLFTTPMLGGSKQPINPALIDVMSSPGLFRYPHSHMTILTQTHTHRLKHKINPKKEHEKVLSL